MNSSKKKRYS